MVDCLANASSCTAVRDCALQGGGSSSSATSAPGSSY
jgi:hypothetical protein